MTTRQRRRRESRRRNHSETSPTHRRLLAAGGLTAGATLAFSGVAQAAPVTYTVGTNADTSSGGACTTPSNTNCSLREAVGLANANAGADTIVFNSNLTGSTISLTTGELLISEALTINGPGASQLTVDGGGTQRIFNINPPNLDVVKISGLTVANGHATAASGGGIYNYDALLILQNSVVTGGAARSTGERGGGVYSKYGAMQINSSRVTGNTAYQGGGVASDQAPTTISKSTLDGNEAFGKGSLGSPPYGNGYGGGIFMKQANLAVDRSTISNNDAGYDGGGIYNSEGGGVVTVSNSTIANNHALHDDGGGIWISTNDSLVVTGSTVTGNTAATHAGGLQDYGSGGVIKNSIVSGNIAANTPANSDVDAHTYTFDASFSLIGRPEGYINTTVPGSNLFGVAPQLGALANNGGPTKTRLPATTSPVVNKGKSFGLATDQRGLTRPVAFPGVANSAAAGADGADIGAVELQLPPPPPPPGGGGTTTPPTTPKKKCKKKKHKRSAQSAKKKKCKKKKKKK
jgi:hypothetical protein